MGKKIWLSVYPRHFGSDFSQVTVRPSALQVYQCKITQSTGVAAQIHFESFLAGNRMASCEAETTKESIKTKLEAEIVSLSVFSKLLKAFFFFFQYIY